MEKHKIIDPYDVELDECEQEIMDNIDVELSEYEQEILDNIDLAGSYSPEETKRKLDELVVFAESHIEERTNISLDLSTHDLKEIKYRASKLGIPFKNIISMVVHRYATSPQKEILL